MKVIVKGTMNIERMAQKLLEVAEHTMAKVEQENEGVKVNGFEIHEAEVTFKFAVEGQDTPQVLTVEHHEGQKELLTWLVDVDAEGAEAVHTNEQESLFDEWTVAQAQGKDHKFKEIPTVYSEDDLTYLPDHDEAYSDMIKTLHDHKDGFKVVRVKQDGKLILEYKLIPTE